jgi:hypothetical protein
MSPILIEILSRTTSPGAAEFARTACLSIAAFFNYDNEQRFLPQIKGADVSADGGPFPGAQVW